MKWLPILFLTTSLFSSTSMAQTQPETQPQEKTRENTQKVLQGAELNLTQMEAGLSQALGARVQVIDLRWPYNPMTYGSFLNGLVYEGQNSGTEIYVLSMTINAEHAVDCYLSFDPSSEKAHLYACASDTAQVVPRDFAFANLGLKINKDRF